MRDIISANQFKIAATLAVIPLVILHCLFSEKASAVADYTGEKIIYTIEPAGRAEYSDLGFVDLKGKKVRLIIFKTHALGFDDTEKIYADANTLLPLRIERDVAMWLGKEYIVEEYDQKNFKLTITKFKNKKKVKEYIFKENGPIHNAILLPFYLRSIPDLLVGWSIDARFPKKFKIKLISIEKIEVPAGEFMAYRFTSAPHKFEIWISRNDPHVPLRIKGAGGLPYTLNMQERVLK